MSKEEIKLEMVDDEGENRAVRMFLALYGGQYGITAEQMRKHLKMAGFDGAWPEWASNHNGHLTKAGAQLWIRHLFALEQPAQQELKTAESVGYSIGFGDGYQAGKDAAPQPAQQEPVEVKQIADALRQVGLTLVRTRGSFRVMDLGRIEAQTTSPPAQRAWVGLTVDEIVELVKRLRDAPVALVDAIEAKLKEKNQ